MRLELVRHPVADVRVGEQHDRGLELLPRSREHGVVEVVQRDDEPHVVLADERDERWDVAGIAIRGTIAWRSAW